MSTAQKAPIQFLPNTCQLHSLFTVFLRLLGMEMETEDLNSVVCRWYNSGNISTVCTRVYQTSSFMRFVLGMEEQISIVTPRFHLGSLQKIFPDVQQGMLTLLIFCSGHSWSSTGQDVLWTIACMKIVECHFRFVSENIINSERETIRSCKNTHSEFPNFFRRHVSDVYIVGRRWCAFETMVQSKFHQTVCRNVPHPYLVSLSTCPSKVPFESLP